MCHVSDEPHRGHRGNGVALAAVVTFAESSSPAVALLPVSVGGGEARRLVEACLLSA